MADKNMERHSMPLGFRAMRISHEERPPHPAWDMNWTAGVGKGGGAGTLTRCGRGCDMLQLPGKATWRSPKWLNRVTV